MAFIPVTQVMVTQSARTSLVLRGAVHQHQIPTDSIVEITQRRATLGIPGTASVSYRDLYFRQGRSTLARALSIPAIDRRIAAISRGRSFDLYLPGVRPHFSQILASHPLRRHLYLIEEGVGSTKPEELACDWTPGPLRTALRYLNVPLRSRHRLAPRSYTPDDFTGAYHVLPEMFDWFPSEKRVQVPIRPNLSNTEVFAGNGLIVCLDYVMGESRNSASRIRQVEHLIQAIGRRTETCDWVAVSVHPQNSDAFANEVVPILGGTRGMNLRAMGVEVESLIVVKRPPVIGNKTSVKAFAEHVGTEWIPTEKAP